MDRRIGSSMQNPLWDYALKAYAAAGVAPACLLLQDEFGIDVTLLLYAAWLGHSDQQLSVQHLGALDAAVTDWRVRVVHPLRSVRRQLRGNAGASDFYAGVKALELRAEQQQLGMMYAFFQQAGQLPAADRPLRQNLEAVATLACPDHRRWSDAIRDLAALIPR